MTVKGQWVEVDSVQKEVYFYVDTTEDVMFLGGYVKYINSQEVNGICKYDGATYKRLGKGSTSCGSNACFVAFDKIKYKGELYVESTTGEFDDTLKANGIARWNGQKWQTVSTGLKRSGGKSGLLNQMTIYKDELYVVGKFDSAGSVAAHNIAKWDGNRWYNVAPNLAVDGIRAIQFYQGELYVAGSFRTADEKIADIAKFNGQEWEPVASGNMFRGSLESIFEMEVYKGELLVAGHFKEPNSPGNFIARWNGTEWRNLGSGISDKSGGGFIEKMEVIDDKLFVAGAFDIVSDISAATIAAWDGSHWCTFDTTVALKYTSISSFGYFRDTFYISPGVYNINDTDFVRTYLMKWTGPLDMVECGKDWTVGVGEVELPIHHVGDLQVFPNPAKNQITIGLKNEAVFNGEIVIKNLQGQVLFRTNEQEVTELKIDINNYSTGSYIVQYGNQSTLFIKQ